MNNQEMLKQWEQAEQHKNNNGSYANVIVNRYKDYIELVHYKHCFKCNSRVENVVEIDRSRLYKVDVNGVLIPNKFGATIQMLADSMHKSGKRALDTLKGYIQSNDWDYFITLTFDKKKVNRLDKNAVGYAWQKYRQSLQRKYPNIKLLLVPELHKKGGIHFHGFIGNANIDSYLVPARNNKKTSKHYGEYLYSSSGSQIYNLTNFKYGFTTCCKIDKESSKLQLAHYISKYITKQVSSGVGYLQKRYYHTYNLDYKDKMLLYMKDIEFANLLEQTKHIEYKNNEQMDVYHFNLHDLMIYDKVSGEIIN